MSGVCGWFGRFDGDSAKAIDSMMIRSAWPGLAAKERRASTEYGLGACGPAGRAQVVDSDAIRLAMFGHPGWVGADGRSTEPLEVAQRFITAYRNDGVDALRSIDGDFALALVDERERRVVLAVDRSAIRNLVYTFANGVLVFGPSCDAVAAHPMVTKRIRDQAIYNYVYFHMVPGPETIFEGQLRLLPGHCAILESGRVSTRPYWQMPWIESEQQRFDELKRNFREALAEGVAVSASGAECGSFLSGGTDSSTVSGLLGRATGKPAKTFSIGFDAEGFDEMEYARIAARHFHADHHEYYVTPADTVNAVPMIAGIYDQPFGNASAVPVYYCAKLARGHGIDRMLAGDGGDELFGGNSRYARQYQLSLYDKVPAGVRKRLIEPLLVGTPLFTGTAFLRRVRSYVEQARMPMPARYESYNLLERLGPGEVFDPGFLASVDPGAPARMLADVYASTSARSMINRLLAIDLKLTLADNDLPKVTQMCEAAEIDVTFPLLHSSVIDFSASLSPNLKLRGTRLRYFFKEALRDFLPPEILAKQKHGFGLPAGVWLRDYPPLRDLAGDALATLRRRRIFRNDFLDALTSVRIREHAGYYGTMVWILMMLELWYREHAR